MQDLSLHALDIAENSIRAGASLIQIELIEDESKNLVLLRIEDNGKGMSDEMLAKVTSPFFTTRTTRRVGLGIALLKQNCVQSEGELVITSRLGQGTKIVATMEYHHMDCLPIGDMTSTLITLIRANPHIDWIYHRRYVSGEEVEVDTRQIRVIMQEVPIDHPEVIQWIKNYLTE